MCDTHTHTHSLTDTHMHSLTHTHTHTHPHPHTHTCVEALVQLLDAVGRARLAVDALRVQAVHLHVLQHHLHHHGDGVLVADQATDAYTKVRPVPLVVALGMRQTALADQQGIMSPYEL